MEGTYSPSTKSDSCMLCPAGKYGPDTNAVAIVLWDGEDDPDFGKPICMDCPDGQYSATLGQVELSNCLLCPRGTFGNQPGRTHIGWCHNCPPGRYGDEYAVKDSGHFNCKVGEACLKSCKNCAAGLYAKESGGTDPSHCIDCEMGKYNEGYWIEHEKLYGIMYQRGLEECKHCAKGRFLPTKGSTEPDDCTRW